MAKPKGIRVMHRILPDLAQLVVSILTQTLALCRPRRILSYMTSHTGVAQRISANVRAIAGRQNIRCQSLGVRAGISQRTMYRLWNGEASWKDFQIEAVADALGVDWIDMTAKHEVAA